MVEIDPIDDANEVDSERDASRERTKDVAKEPNSLCRVQLGRSCFFIPAAHGDRRAACSAQIAHPLDLPPGGPDPTPAGGPDDRHRRSARQAALPAANGDEPIEAQRNASGQKELGDWVEEGDPPWDTSVRRRHICGAASSIAHSIAHLRSSFSLM